MTALDDSYEALGSALIYLGYNPNSIDPEEVEEAKAVLFEQKKNLIAYVDTPTRMFAEQEAVLSVMWAGDIWWTAQELPNIQMAIPKEGTMMGFDGLVLPAGGKNPAAKTARPADHDHCGFGWFGVHPHDYPWDIQ